MRAARDAKASVGSNVLGALIKKKTPNDFSSGVLLSIGVLLWLPLGDCPASPAIMLTRLPHKLNYFFLLADKNYFLDSLAMQQFLLNLFAKKTVFQFRSAPIEYQHRRSLPARPLELLPDSILSRISKWAFDFGKDAAYDTIRRFSFEIICRNEEFDNTSKVTGNNPSRVHLMRLRRVGMPCRDDDLTCILFLAFLRHENNCITVQVLLAALLTTFSKSVFQRFLDRCFTTSALVAGDDFSTDVNQGFDTALATNNGMAPQLYCQRNYTADKNARAAWAFAQVYPELYSGNCLSEESSDTIGIFAPSSLWDVDAGGANVHYAYSIGHDFGFDNPFDPDDHAGDYTPNVYYASTVYGTL